MDEIYWTAAAHRRHPGLPMKVVILVDDLDELLGSIIHRSHVADEEASKRAHVDRRTQGVVDECVCARILNRAADLSQQRRVARIPIAIWIAPNADRYRRPIHRRVWEKRRSPGNAYYANHRLTRNDVELVKPKRLEVLRSVTKSHGIFRGSVIDHLNRIRNQGTKQASGLRSDRAATVDRCREIWPYCTC